MSSFSNFFRCVKESPTLVVRVNALLGVVLGIALGIALERDFANQLKLASVLARQPECPHRNAAFAEDAIQVHLSKKTEIPILHRTESRPVSDAWNQTPSTIKGGSLRHSDFDLEFVAKTGPTVRRSFLRQHHIGNRQTGYPQPPLEVLFCTWQI